MSVLFLHQAGLALFISTLSYKTYSFSPDVHFLKSWDCVFAGIDGCHGQAEGGVQKVYNLDIFLFEFTNRRGLFCKKYIKRKIERCVS